MGLLLDRERWASLLNEMVALKPPLGEPMTPDATQAMRALACQEFSALVADPELADDIKRAMEVAAGASIIDSPQVPDFVQQFMILEARILAESGVNFAAQQDLLEEIRTLDRSDLRPLERFERLQDKLVFCARLACTPQDNLTADLRDSIGVRCWRAAKGVTLISVDVGACGGAAAAMNVVGAAMACAVFGGSVGYGADFIGKAIKGLW